MSRQFLGSKGADVPLEPDVARDRSETGRTEEVARAAVATATPAARAGAVRAAAARLIPRARPKASALYVLALLSFIVLEFARPPVVSQLKLQLVITMALPVAMVFTRLRWWHPTMGIWLAFFALCVIQVPVAYNNYSAYVFARNVYGGVSIALCIAWALQNLTDLRKGLLVWTFSLTYVAIFAITHGGRGPSGFMGDENDMALACATAFPFAFFGFERLTGWKKLVAGGLAVVFVVAIVVSFSRGGFVGLAAVGLFCFYFSRKKLQNIAVGILAIVLFLALAPQSYLDELKTIQDTDEGTAESRQFLWEAAVGMWRDSPVIGVGGGGSNFLVGRFQPRSAKYDHDSYRLRSWSGQAVHSLYFQLLAEMGSVGVALYVSLIYMHFRVLNRLRRDVARQVGLRDPLSRQTELYAGCLAAGMVGFLVPAIFISVLHYPYVWYLSAFGIALDRAVRAELERRVPAARRVSPAVAPHSAAPSAVPA